MKTHPASRQRVPIAFLFCLSLCSLCLCGESSVWGQTELSKPYDLHIVVHVAPNRLLTNVLRDRIERELHDGVQAALGDMGNVTVVDLDQELSKNKKKTPALQRLADVRAQGLQRLNEWKERSEVKTHFIFIDYADGHYEIQARQYDGVVGRASPVVRRDRTRDRDFVAKAAILLIKQDFGVLGTVQTEAAPPRGLVKVELRGGELGSMARWVKQGDVFALAPPGGGSPLALNWAYLVVDNAPGEDARDGACMCRFYHRYRVPSIVGYRCIKLGTVTAPLRLRWMQEAPGRNATRRPLPKGFTLTVDIRRNGFDGEEATRMQKILDNGILETVADGEKGVFKNIAFVRVTSGLPEPLPQVPVALVDDQPIYVEVNTAVKGSNTLLSFRKAAWQRSVADSRLMQDTLFRRLELLGTKVEEREQLIEEAERGLKRCQEERNDLIRQKDELVQDAKDSGSQMTTLIEDRHLKELEKGEQVLKDFIKQQKDIEDKENDPQVKNWRREIERAKLLEEKLEFGKAIAIYEKIKKEGYQNADLDKHLADLHKRWDPADDDHRSQRSYIYNVWPTLDSSQLEENIPKARQALQKCDKEKDAISISKLLKGTEVHADRLAKELGELRPDLVTDDEREAKKLKKVSDEILKFGKEIQQSLQKLQGDEG